MSTVLALDLSSPDVLAPVIFLGLWSFAALLGVAAWRSAKQRRQDLAAVDRARGQVGEALAEAAAAGREQKPDSLAARLDAVTTLIRDMDSRQREVASRQRREGLLLFLAGAILGLPIGLIGSWIARALDIS